MSFIVAGIDPGLKGAIAYINVGDRTLRIEDMPIYTEKKPDGRKKNYVSGKRLASSFKKEKPNILFVEKVHSMPHDGHVGAFSFGMGYGTIHGVADALIIQFDLVRPVTWKRELMVPANKFAAIERSHELFPACTGILKKDGPAEAAMIALYGCLIMGKVPEQGLEPVNG